MISTRCCSPTESCQTNAFGSTRSPYSRESSRMRAVTLFRSSRGARVDGWPSATFWATVMVGTSMKCWWIMPIPALMASAGERKLSLFPSMKISPSSG